MSCKSPHAPFQIAKYVHLYGKDADHQNSILKRQSCNNLRPMADMLKNALQGL